MINRHYFMSVKKYHGDGSAEFGCAHAKMTHRSWLPDASAVYRDAVMHFQNELKSVKGDDIHVIAFNRV